jgi:hypothetical protein
MTMKPFKTFSLLAHVLLLIVISLITLTGFGITNYQLVQDLTFGLLSKSLSFQLHEALVIPLILLLGLHIALVVWKH